MIDQRFILIGALLSLYGGSSYVVSTLRGEAKPNRVTWFLWMIVPAIALSAQLSEGVRWQAIITFVAGFNPLMIFLASFINRKAYWKVTSLDVVCGLMAILAIALWLMYRTADIALLFSIMADALAGFPTIIKAYHHPETENHRVFLFGAVNAVITLLTIKHISFANSAFAIYLLSICLVLIALIKLRLGTKFSQTKTAS